MSLRVIRIIFGLAGLYDLVLGVAFLFFAPRIFAAANIPPVNHWGYVQFGALMIIIFGIMFCFIANDPIRHRNLMPYGMFLKLSYTGLVLYYWVAGECHAIFQPFAVIDGIMLVLFLMAYQRTPQMSIAPQGTVA
jgi:hypothetical protein